MKLYYFAALLLTIEPTLAWFGSKPPPPPPPPPPPAEFSLIVIKGYSQIQYTAVYAENDALYIGKYTGLRLRFINGTVCSLDEKKFLLVDANRNLVMGDTPKDGFLMEGGYLILANEGFFGCPAADGKTALGLFCNPGFSIALKTMDVTLLESKTDANSAQTAFSPRYAGANAGDTAQVETETET